MTNTSVTLEETGIAGAINDRGPYDSARTKMLALDYATQLPEIKAVAGQASTPRQRPRRYPRRNPRNRFGLRQPARCLRLGRRQRHLRRRCAEARPRPGSGARADRRAQPSARRRPAPAAYGQNSRVGKVLEIHQEDPGRIHVVLIRQPVGF